MLRIVIFMFLGLGVLAAQTSRDPDPEATKILQQLEGKIHGYADMTYQFSLKIEIPDSETQSQKGLFYTKGDMYRLEGDNYILVTNGKNQWVVNKEAKEIQIHDFEPLDPDNLSHPKNLLAIYHNPEFDYRLEFEGAEGELLIQQIEFKPLRKDSEYTKARITINKKTGMISQIDLHTKDGSSYFLRIDKTSPNQKLATALFEINKDDFPNHKIEDLRLN